MTIGGNVCVRNGFELGYCFKEAIESLLPICDEVVCCDCDSTDGTRRFLEEWKLREPKINICNFPWTDPKGDPGWWVEYLNYARQHLNTDWHFQLDADEVIGPESYPAIKFFAEHGDSMICNRLNFWKDPQHTIPHGECCGNEVIRGGPKIFWMPSDYPDPRGETIMKLAQPAKVTVYHYGFIRNRKAWFKKAREVQRIWANDYDKRLEAAESYEGDWSTMPGVTGWIDQLQEYKGTHPLVIHQWLKDNGHTIA
jgi:glycosyltransferase involved in cell wall biosynthesis